MIASDEDEGEEEEEEEEEVGGHVEVLRLFTIVPFIVVVLSLLFLVVLTITKKDSIALYKYKHI